APAAALAAAPLATGSWQLAGAGLTDWRPAYANPSATLDVTLEKDGRRVGVYIAYYRRQGYEREMIGSGNVLVRSGDEEWAIAGRGQAQALLGGVEPVTLHVATLRRKAVVLGDAGTSRLRVWHAYWIDDRIVTSDLVGKLLLAFGRLAGRGDDAAAVFIVAAESGGDALIADYLATAGPAIAALLAQTAAARNPE
ncbi:MAG: EpsI family protein, partial [Sulfuritalea sp.]|nr:EpsI family protein [Sulfuritalea sp.]